MVIIMKIEDIKKEKIDELFENIRKMSKEFYEENYEEIDFSDYEGIDEYLELIQLNSIFK